MNLNPNLWRVRFARFAAAATLLAACTGAGALTCLNTATGNWSAAANWVCNPGAVNRVPLNIDDVQIRDKTTITVNIAGAVAGSVTVLTGPNNTRLNLGGSGDSLTVTNAGGLSGDVVIQAPTANVTKQISVGARSLTVTGNMTLNGGTAGGGGTNRSQLAVTSGIVTIGGALNINAGTVNTSVARVTLTSGRVTVAGATTLTGGATASRDALLTLSGASAVGNGYVLNSTLDVDAPTVAGSSTVSFTGAAGGRITVAGNVTNRDTLTVGAGIFTANGTTFATTASTHSATTSVTTGTLTIAGNATVNASNTSNNTATVTLTTGRIDVAGNATVTGGNAASRNALLRVTAAPAVAGNGINIGGSLNNVVAGGTVTTATTSITAANGVINVTGAGGVNNGGTVTVGPGIFTVSNAAATYTNSSALVAARTTVSSGSLDISGDTGALANAAGETISISTTGNITVGNTGTKTGTLTNGGTITITAGGTVNSNGNFTSSGTFTNTAAGQLFLRGATSTVNGTFNRGTGTVAMEGAVAQSLSGTELSETPAANGLNNFIINNAAGVTLGSTAAVKGTLTFTAGNVTTGANTLIAMPNCTAPSVVRVSGHVDGNLRKTLPNGASTCTFEIGTGASYAPVVISFPAGTTTGNLTASTTGGDHGSLVSSSIDPAKSVNRYWSVINNTVGGIGAGVTMNFNFVTPSDYDAAGDPAKFFVQRFSAGWSTEPLSPTCPAIDGAHLCNQIVNQTAFNDFAIGEANYTMGNAGWFNAFETSTGAGTHLGNVYTKLHNAGYNLDVVAVNALRNGVKANYSTNPITVELLDASDNSGALVAETDCRSSWALIPGQSFALAPVWANSRATVAIPALAAARRNVRVRVTQGTLVGCSTDNYTIRPTAFTVTSTNATNTGASGTPTFKAGSATFNLAATSVAGYNGAPSVDNTAGMLVGTPNQGTIGGTGFSTAPIGTGIASGTFTYSEVGNFGLAANAVYDSSFTSVDTPGTDCSAGFSNALDGAGRYGCSIGSTAVAQTTGVSGFGRFIPDHFDVSTNSPTFAAACTTGSGFTYLGQSFSYSAAPVLTVTARNAGGATTANYRGSFFKLTNGSLTGKAYTAASGTLDTSLITAPDPAIVDNADGTAALTFNSGTGIAFTRSTPVAPFDAEISLAINVIDTDTIAYGSNPARFGQATSGNGIGFAGGKAQRFGRLRMLNASGSEKVDLPIPLAVQYWTGTGFATNGLDGCTSLSAANFSFSAYTGGIAAGNMNAANISLGGAFVSGAGSLKLVKPTTPVPTTPGSVTLTVDLAAEGKSYLQGNWGVVTYTANPKARAAFGLFGAQPKQFIFYRENH